MNSDYLIIFHAWLGYIKACKEFALTSCQTFIMVKIGKHVASEAI